MPNPPHCRICGTPRDLMKAAVKQDPICWVCYRLKASVEREASDIEKHMKDEEAHA